MKKNMPLLLIILIFGNMLSACNDNKIPVTAEIDKAVANVYKNCGIPLYEAVKMATYNPAKHCNVHGYKGSIKEGYDADLLLFDEDITIKKVFVKGKEVLL